MNDTPHTPVLLDPVLDALLPAGRPVTRAIDGTLGAGGHTQALLDGGAAQVLSFDLDPDALHLAAARLAPYGPRSMRVHASYAQMRQEAARVGWADGVDAILLDLGVSSMQVDNAARGFAFRLDGPLDMRFDPRSDALPAAEIVNAWDADSLADLLYRYGEEPDARRIARAIVAHRESVGPINTTAQLAALIADAVPSHSQRRRSKGKTAGPRIHPATRTFQALRIVVNAELQTVETALPAAIALLRPGGRLAVISFHSLEDRLVKQAFREASTEIVSPPGMVLPDARAAVVRLLTRKPIVADEAEIARNPRSRSAKLRVVEKLDPSTSPSVMQR